MPRSPAVQSMTRSALRGLLALPAPLLRRALGPAPRNDRGHALDLQIQLLLRLMRPWRGPPARLGLARMRGDMDREAPLVDLAPAALHRVEDLTLDPPGVPPLRARLYEPAPPAGAPRPLCLFFHGGGWTLGSLTSHDAVCRFLAARAGCLVLAVDYRMGPEHRFPAAAHDALAAFRWVQANADALGVDPRRLGVAGDSAGGNLAALVAQAAREAVRYQLLVYPATDLTRSHDSHRTYASGFLLEKDTLDWFLEQYLAEPEREAHEPLASPLRARALEGLAPAYVLTAGFDPLRDEGEAYARRLAEAGVPVEARCEEALIHGFFSMGGAVAAARAAVERAADALGRGLTRPRDERLPEAASR